MFKRIKIDEKYNKKVSLLANKLTWLTENQEVKVLLLASLEPMPLPEFCCNTVKEIQKMTSKSVAIYELSFLSQITPEIDWDHELLILYLNNSLENPHLSTISSKIDQAYLLLKSSVTSRNDAQKTISKFKDFNIDVNGLILHEYVEKVPNFIKRVFF